MINNTNNKEGMKMIPELHSIDHIVYDKKTKDTARHIFIYERGLNIDEFPNYYCGYVQVLPTDAIYKLVTNYAELYTKLQVDLRDKLDQINQAAIGGITHVGRHELSAYPDEALIGFDTLRGYMPPITLREVIQSCDQIAAILDKCNSESRNVKLNNVKT